MDDAQFFPASECGAQLLLWLGTNGYRLDSYSQQRHGFYFTLESTVARANRIAQAQQQAALVAQLQNVSRAQDAPTEMSKPDLHMVEPIPHEEAPQEPTPQ